VLADDPRLDVRLPDETGGQRHQPLRVVLDSSLRTPPEARLFTVAGEVLIVTAAPVSDPRWEPRCAALAERGARIEMLPAVGERVPLAAVLERLGELETNELQVEAGPTLAGELLRQGLADELLLYVAPKLLGPSARPLLAFPELTELEAAPAFDIAELARLGDDLRLRLKPRMAGGTEA
jgi:diaminohydroxyphosphoribosylaminopyrimidine deaminase/5-amino-6-(5-phosphoribosylamino)uracil reductase